MKKKLSQGALAVMNGNRLENAVASFISYGGYEFRREKTLGQLLDARESLFQPRGVYTKQCDVPLRAMYHNAKGLARVDFVVLPISMEVILISTKSQTSDGSADEKPEFEYWQLLDTEYPSALLIDGPLKGRDPNPEKPGEGWSPRILGPIWQRMLHHGRGLLYPFRSIDKLGRWIRDGFPVAGRGRTWSSIIGEYCDREP